jgi:choline dehydrogenase
MTEKQMFDYIVVGSGSAGGQLAARLSENGAHRVLLLEGGASHKRDLMVSMPAGWGAMTYSKRHSWGHMTEPERWAGGRRLMMPRGKVLGGSSSINGMIYIRGHRQDYADWQAAGAEGWGWNELLPYFVRTEDQQRLQNKYHGRGGPLHVADLPSVHPITHAMIAAAQQAGLEHVDDFNDGSARGAGTLQVNVRDGKRSSIAVNAIEPAMKRGNLQVITHALVLRITTEAGRATGVAYRIGDGPAQWAGARSEVLLCAGAIHSPQLLMLSGMGPAAHLREQGIAVVADLPGVGANLQDHCCVPMSWRLRPGVSGMNSRFQGLGLAASVLRYLLTRRGPMTSPPAEFGAYLKSDPALPYNDIQVFGLPVTGDPEAHADKSRAPTPDRFEGITLAPYQVRPFSRGSIRLRLPDVTIHPVIRMNYVDDARDRRALLWALRFLRDMATKPALAALVESEFRPGPGVQSDAEWLDWLAPHLTTGYHPVGTCRVGRADDAMAVVAPDLKVRGVQGLRVIDASVMPNVICGNTNATAVVIGDKGADLVLGRAPLAAIAD